VGVDEDVDPGPPTPEDQALAARIAHLAQEPSVEARARIMAAVRSTPMPATAPRSRFASGRRWRVALVGLGTTALLLGASAGALAASSDALPSSPAYGLRRFEENLRVAVADQREQPRLRLEFAAEKLRQAKALTGRGDVNDASRLLVDCQHDLQDAQHELHDVHDPTEVLHLAGQEAQLQTDAANQLGQVDNIVNGGTTTPPQESSAPGDNGNPGTQGTSLPEPAASSDSGGSGSTNSTITP
jgi:hypothetical protein